MENNLVSLKVDETTKINVLDGMVNPRNAKWQCSGCDYLCSLLTPSDAVPPILCAIFSDKNNESYDARWRQIK